MRKCHCRDYFWRHAPAGEMVLGRLWCGTRDRGRLVASGELGLGPWCIFNLCLELWWLMWPWGAASCVGMGSRKSSTSTTASHRYPQVLERGEEGLCRGCPTPSWKQEMEILPYGHPRVLPSCALKSWGRHGGYPVL